MRETIAPGNGESPADGGAFAVTTSGRDDLFHVTRVSADLPRHAVLVAQPAARLALAAGGQLLADASCLFFVRALHQQRTGG